MEFPVELKYTKEHEWVRLEGEVAYIGITDFAQDQLGDVVFLELPESGDEIEKGDAFGVVESVKAVSDLYSPLSGKVLENNEPLIDAPEMINEHPYDDGWMIKIELSDAAEIKDLLSMDEYSTFIKEISES